MPAPLTNRTAPLVTTPAVAPPPAPLDVQPPVTTPVAPAGDAFTTTAQNNGVAQTEAAAAVKPAAAATIDPKTPPSLTGKLSMENGQITLDSPAGKFTVVNASGGGDSLHFFAASDVQAFVGRVVTVRGWPTDGWMPGAAQ